MKKNLTNTISKRETERLDLVMSLIQGSRLSVYFADCFGNQTMTPNYRKGTVTVHLKTACFRQSDGRLKTNVALRANDLLNHMRDVVDTEVSYAAGGDQGYNIEFTVRDYHEVKYVDLPRNYGKGTLNGNDLKVARLASVIKELWGHSKAEYTYSVEFFLHEGGKVSKRSTRLSINGYPYYGRDRLADFGAMQEAARLLGNAIDDYECEPFLADSATVYDKETKDAYSFDL